MLQKNWFFVFVMLFLFKPSVESVNAASLGNLAGKVVDRETDKPVAGAIVTVIGERITYSIVTDQEGNFSFVRLKPGPYELTISFESYQTFTLADLVVTADSTSSQVYKIEKVAEKVIKVRGARKDMTLDLRQPNTLYGFSSTELDDLLPGPAQLNTNAILQELPGVQTYQGLGGYALTLPGGPHVRGGSGLGTAYSLDGIPLNNYTLFGDPGNLGLTTGLSQFQFYPGVYPVQYGNGMDGYQNAVVPEGFGDFHGSLQLSYGFWLDQGQNSPMFAANSQTGVIGGKIGTSNVRPANPDYWSLQFQGETGKLHYFFNHVAQDGGQSGYANSVAEAALTYSGVGGQVYRKVARDGLLKLTYDLDNNSTIGLLWADGFNWTSSEFELFTNGSTATFQPVPPFTYQNYDIESLNYSHHFSSEDVLSFRLWQYNSNPDFYTPSAANGFFYQNDIAKQKGIRLAYEGRIASQHKISAGWQYIYTNDFQNMTIVSPNPLAALVGNTDFAGANNQNLSAWLNDEWSPTSRLSVNFGLRWDQMLYQTPVAANLLTQSNGLPFAIQSFTSFSPDNTLNNSNDTQGLFTRCTPQFNICIDHGILSPSFVQPRISVAYQLANGTHLKGSFGQFVTFADDQAVFAVSNLCAAGSGVSYGTPCNAIGNVAYTTAGNRPEHGNVYDLSLEYELNSKSFIKITPYYKKVYNPLVYIYVPIASAGGMANATGLTSKGVELELHTRDWHGLSGFLNYTYNNATIIGNPEYSFTLLPQFLATSPVSGAASIQPNAFSNAAAAYNQINSESISTDWDIRHAVNLLLNYKLSSKWEIAPNFIFASGQPYGLGAPQLQSLSANLQAACNALPNANNASLNATTCAQDLSANANPLNESAPNSLRGSNVFVINLAVTCHVTDFLSTTLSIFNLVNNSQISAYNSTPYFPTFMAAFGYPNAPDYSPLHGQYAPNAVQSIRQYFLTTTLKF